MEESEPEEIVLPKKEGTAVAARYMRMAREMEAGTYSDNWEPTEEESPQPEPERATETARAEVYRPEVLRDEVPRAETTSTERADSGQPVPASGLPPMPLIEDHSSLAEEHKNILVNAVWYRCENPYCKFTRFLTVHHIIDEKDGGPNTLDNLIVLCPYCHDLAHRKEIPEKEMRDWVSNREERFKFKPDWPYR